MAHNRCRLSGGMFAPIYSLRAVEQKSLVEDVNVYIPLLFEYHVHYHEPVPIDISCGLLN